MLKNLKHQTFNLKQPCPGGEIGIRLWRIQVAASERLCPDSIGITGTEKVLIIFYLFS
jgi:hypothetical protein